MNEMMIIKYSSTAMQGKRKLCECHTRFFFLVILNNHLDWKDIVLYRNYYCISAERKRCLDGESNPEI